MIIARSETMQIASLQEISVNWLALIEESMKILAITENVYLFSNDMTPFHWRKIPALNRECQCWISARNNRAFISGKRKEY